MPPSTHTTSRATRFTTTPLATPARKRPPSPLAHFRFHTRKGKSSSSPGRISVRECVGSRALRVTTSKKIRQAQFKRGKRITGALQNRLLTGAGRGKHQDRGSLIQSESATPTLQRRFCACPRNPQRIAPPVVAIRCVHVSFCSPCYCHPRVPSASLTAPQVNQHHPTGRAC